jgi:hypothetical protein
MQNREIEEKREKEEEDVEWKRENTTSQHLSLLTSLHTLFLLINSLPHPPRRKKKEDQLIFLYLTQCLKDTQQSEQREKIKQTKTYYEEIERKENFSIVKE